MVERMRQHGQSTAEYAVVISVIIAVAVGMQLYVKRSMQGKLKQAADTYTSRGTTALGVASTMRQYEPYYTAAGSLDNEVHNLSKEIKTQGGKIETDVTDTSIRRGATTQGADLAQDDDWD